MLTCGCGAHGQLGHGNTFNASRLRMIFELMGTAVSQVVCGRWEGTGEGVGRGGGGSRGSFTPCNLFAVLIVCST